LIAPSGIFSFNQMALQVSLIERRQHYFLVASWPIGNARHQSVACDILLPIRYQERSGLLGTSHPIIIITALAGDAAKRRSLELLQWS